MSRPDDPHTNNTSTILFGSAVITSYMALYLMTPPSLTKTTLAVLVVISLLNGVLWLIARR